jgi:hypothetical protein
MFGSFDTETLKKYAHLAAEKAGVDFAEDDTYDFTRCVRSDGSVYGTSGKCRKGTETGAKEEEGSKGLNLTSEQKKAYEQAKKEGADSGFSDEMLDEVAKKYPHALSMAQKAVDDYNGQLKENLKEWKENREGSHFEDYKSIKEIKKALEDGEVEATSDVFHDGLPPSYNTIRNRLVQYLGQPESKEELKESGAAEIQRDKPDYEDLKAEYTG